MHQCTEYNSIMGIWLEQATAWDVCVSISIMGFIDGDTKITSLKRLLGWSKCYKFKPHWGTQVYPAFLTVVPFNQNWSFYDF